MVCWVGWCFLCKRVRFLGLKLVIHVVMLEEYFLKMILALVKGYNRRYLREDAIDVF